MSTSMFVILSVLLVGAAGLIIVNLTGDPGTDYWDLDGENEHPSSVLDNLRSKTVFYGAGVVLIGLFILYLFLCN